MRIQRPPRRIRKLDNLFREAGGVRAYVLRRLDDEGIPIEEVAETLTQTAEERIPIDTLYGWARTWRRELAQSETREEATAST